MAGSATVSAYELPPFELVKLLQPAFQSLPRLDAGFTTSPPGSSSGAAASSVSPPTLSNRLSQLVNKNAAIAQQQRLAAPAEVSTSPTPGPSGIQASLNAKAQIARTAEAGGDTVWIAGSEGSVAVWKLDPSRSKGKERAAQQDNEVAATAEEAAYLLDQYGVVPGRRPIEKLAVLSTVAKAVILTEGVLTIHSLPTFGPLAGIAPIRGVSTFAVDLSDPHSGSVPLCVIKRKSMQLYVISYNTIELVKELPLRTTAILGVLRGHLLCIADSTTYSLVNLESATLTPLLPISQDPPDSPEGDDNSTRSPETVKPKSYQRPSILAIGEDEFLIASHTGHSTLGLFINENGDPTRGTLEWASNPKSIVIDYPHVVALLQNNTLEVHSIITQELVQVLRSAGSSARPHSTASVPSTPVKPSSVSPSLETFQPKLLISCAAGFPGRQYSAASGVSAFSPLLVPQVSGANGLDRVTVRFFPEKSLLDEPNEPEMSSPAINEPPSTPKRTMSGLAATRPRSPAGKGAPSSTIAVNSILLGRDSAFALCPLTLVTQAEALIASSKVEEALAMLAAVGTPDTPEKVSEFCYIQQRAAWTYLSETRFKEAGALFTAGRTDPRLLLRLFPDVAGHLLDNLQEETVVIFAGLQGLLGGKVLHQQSIGAIISRNLARNYSPHLPPDSPSMTDLNAKLEKEARIMLRDYLRRWRNERRAGNFASLALSRLSPAALTDLDKLVDTSLAKLLLENADQVELLIAILVSGNHACDVDEIAGLLEARSLHSHLAELYLRQGRLGEVLRIWSELVDGERTDVRFTNGLTKVHELLTSSTNLDYVTKYGLWLVERDRELGLSLLLRPAKDLPIDVDYCLERLEALDREAADRFLEHSVFQRRNLDARLYDALLDRYLGNIEALLADEANVKQSRALRAEYASSADATETTIVSYALAKEGNSAMTAFRGRLALMLHACPRYDTRKMRARLDNIGELQYETAIVLSRLNMHDEALAVLAKTLRDTASANAYCTQAGTEVLNPRLVREILEKLSIPLPTALYRKDGRRKHSPTTLTAEDREDRRSSLLNALIRITLQLANEDNTEIARQGAAHTIEAQAVRLTASEILPSIPDEWPLPLMESFLVRDLRRTLHFSYERKLTKAILQGQALDASLKYWDVMDSMGAVLAEEERASDDGKGGPPGEKGVVYLEKGAEVENEKAVDLL